MNDIIVNRWAMGLAVFSFGFLSIGSFLFGATATTSVLRGLGGGVLFGALLWLVGLLISEEEDAMESESDGEVSTDAESTDTELPVIDPDAVRKKFLKKSSELAEKAKVEKEEKYNEEATPF